MDHHDGPSGRAEARLVADYLKSLRGLVNQATASRQIWIRQLGSLIKEGREDGGRVEAARQAGDIGQLQHDAFARIKQQVAALEAPARCQNCQLIVLSWLEKQMAACEVMIEVGRTGQLEDLRTTQGLLAEGRDDTRRFTGEYSGLVEWIRQQVNSASRVRQRAPARGRWPFGRTHPPSAS